MKIGLNATCINNRPSGANQRFAGIYKELFVLMPESEFVIYHSIDSDLSSWFQSPNIRYIETPIHSKGGIWKFLYHLTFWQEQFKNEAFDYFECFNINLHELIHHHYEYHSRTKTLLSPNKNENVTISNSAIDLFTRLSRYVNFPEN